MVNDSISRQAAIEAIVNAVSRIGLHDNSEVARYGATFRQQEILDIIDALPSAQPERKKGRWIKVNGKTVINCSACHHCSWSLSFEDTVRRFNFCPNCGADMQI